MNANSLPNNVAFSAGQYKVIDEATLLAPAATNVTSNATECCLVQIYPADAVTGMLIIEEESLVAGRDESSELFLPNNSVSRRHAEFRRSPQGYVLHDLNSTNGTLVNGQKISECELQSGDTIQIGFYLFKFLAADSVESQYHETVYLSMTRDALTGAMNKRYLLEYLEREIARSYRQQSPLAAMMIDIDYFKRINDSYGHLVGDEVLREFGKRLQAMCRSDDLLARYGGEEFCLTLVGAGRNEALGIAEACRAAICNQLFETAGGDLAVTASFGVSMLDPSQREGVMDLLRRADACLYQAKNAGRNRVGPALDTMPS